MREDSSMFGPAPAMQPDKEVDKSQILPLN